MADFSYIIVFVSDMARSVAFYRDVLGLPLRSESPKWTEFEKPGMTLALHLTDAQVGAAVSPDAIPAGRCNLGLTVDDLDRFHKEMLAKGVTCLQPPQEEDFGGRLAGYADPDGQPFSVSSRSKRRSIVRLDELHTHYAAIYSDVLKGLAALNVPPAVKEFRLTEDHELPVLQAFDWLLARKWWRFQDYDGPKGLAVVSATTLEAYRRHAEGNELVLRCALLLHDITRGRNRHEPHSEMCFETVRMIESTVKATLGRLGSTQPDSDVERVAWLVRWHDILGNIYTGERDPNALLRSISGLPSGEDVALSLLPVMVLCDMRGTSDGRFLTNEKATYWLSLSKMEAIQPDTDRLFRWRIKRWTGDTDGRSRELRATAVFTLIEGWDTADPSDVEDVFGNRIDRIAYGFYLFVDLSVEELARLMVETAHAWRSRDSQYAPYDTMSVEFDKYKSFEPGTHGILASYRRQLQSGKLNVVWEERKTGGGNGRELWLVVKS